MGAVLFMFTVAKLGAEVEFSTGDIVPLKLITPVEVELMAVRRLMF
jgi:hypothetical protein